jgi:putative PIN family toxin of toxin-antitoxin system
MIRVVLDTSVLVSAVVSSTGPNAKLFDLIAAGKIRPCLTDDVLAEYYRVFDYERLQHLDRRRVARLRGLLEAIGLKFKSRGRVKISDHEDDNRVYECAVAAQADYIVTENTKHFKRPYKITKITTARNLLKVLEGERGEVG